MDKFFPVTHRERKMMTVLSRITLVHCFDDFVAADQRSGEGWTLAQSEDRAGQAIRQVTAVFQEIRDRDRAKDRFELDPFNEDAKLQPV